MDGTFREQHLAAARARARARRRRRRERRSTSRPSPQALERRAARPRADHALASRSRQGAAGAARSVERGSWWWTRPAIPCPPATGSSRSFRRPVIRRTISASSIARRAISTAAISRARAGTIVIPARKGGDLRAYLASLQLVRDLGAAPAAARTRPDRRRSGGAHRRVHRAPAEARAADPAGDPRRGEDGGRDRAPRLPGAARVAQRRRGRQRPRASGEAPRRRARVSRLRSRGLGSGGFRKALLAS